MAARDELCPKCGFARPCGKTHAVRDEAGRGAWAAQFDYCFACGISGSSGQWSRWLETHHIIKVGRSDEPCNLCRLCHRCHRLAELDAIRDDRGELLPKLTLAIVLTIKQLRDPESFDIDRLRSLNLGRITPDLQPIPKFFLQEFAMHRPWDGRHREPPHPSKEREMSCAATSPTCRKSGIQAKLEDWQVAEMRTLRNMRPDFWSHQQLSDRYGIHVKTIARILRGRARMQIAGPIEDAAESVSMWGYNPNVTVWCDVCKAHVHPPCQMCRLRKQLESGEGDDDSLEKDEPAPAAGPWASQN